MNAVAIALTSAMLTQCAGAVGSGIGGRSVGQRTNVSASGLSQVIVELSKQREQKRKVAKQNSGLMRRVPRTRGNCKPGRENSEENACDGIEDGTCAQWFHCDDGGNCNLCEEHKNTGSCSKGEACDYDR
eukprot:TRINITY_DN1923_c0_g1_i2.p1 TRINITY_DN1923_c0_g1~~TRINITY_DN1923_c0_g1_i2.p1  ORF type:complete len:130 (-),score=15.36 TRINITY_DN1923_c0_g1_i2:48-437(-)